MVVDDTPCDEIDRFLPREKGFSGPANCSAEKAADGGWKLYGVT